VEVLEADERTLHVGLRTSLSISYEGDQAMLGPGIAESLLAGDEDAQLAAWLLREGEVTAAAAAERFDWPEQEARRRLQEMTDAGRARAMESGTYAARMAARRGRRIDPEIWTRLGAEQGGGRPETKRPGRLKRALASSVGRATISSLPTAALAAAAAALILAGTASVAGPIRIVGIIAFATISGVLPPMLVLAARRRSDVVTTPSRLLAGPELMSVTGVAAIAAVILCATVLWSDPAERALAAAAAVVAPVSLILAARYGAFRPIAVLELRQFGGAGPVRIRGQERGRDLELKIGERVVHEAEVSLEPGRPPVKIHGRSGATAELRISARRLDPSGGSEALPITVALPRKSSLQMAEIGGVATLTVEPAGWTVELRPEQGTDSRATGSPLDRL
jgi:hypothetical protein